MHFEAEYPDKVVLLFGKETAGFSKVIRDQHQKGFFAFDGRRFAFVS